MVITTVGWETEYQSVLDRRLIPDCHGVLQTQLSFSLIRSRDKHQLGTNPKHQIEAEKLTIRVLGPLL